LRTSDPAARQRAGRIFRVLRRAYPDAHCELDFKGPFQLAVATILSAQCTDKAVNKATPALFGRYPDAAALAAARLGELELMIRSMGLFRAKARNLKAMAQGLITRHQGRVPRSLEELTALPGIGRKTANVILSNAFGLPGLAVDTHVLRGGRRLGLHTAQDPAKAETALTALLQPKDWGLASHLLIWHGRRSCTARDPGCGSCPLARLCPSVGGA